MGQQGSHFPVTTPQTPNSATNINVANTPALLGTAIPAHITTHDKGVVGISGPKLAEKLEVYYRAGVRQVETVVLVAGQPLVIDGTIYVRRDRRSGRTYFWIYPLQPAQSVLRDLYLKHRGGVAPRAKRPMPIIVLTVTPKLKK
jgi:hypothetical protein